MQPGWPQCPFLVRVALSVEDMAVVVVVICPRVFLVKVTSWAGLLISVGVKKKSCASFLDIYLLLLSKGDRIGCNDNRETER